MNICKLCKFWGIEDYNFAECKNRDTQESLSPTLSIGEIAHIEYIETHADFGCINWEEKYSENTSLPRR